jgi:ABC-2 type transport system ATP-binding protein
MSAIAVSNVTKKFIVKEKKTGLTGAVKGLLFPKKKTVMAVDDVSFTVPQGEITGYIGPNGAGKSTTIKMLCGILHPTSGTVEINGVSPHLHRKKVVGNIGVVFGQRTQLYWDIRLGESFELLRRIYRIHDDTYNKNLGLMNELLGINEFIDTPVRQLSLGQRMKGDLVASFLHSPDIIFLDEPTIGLDIHAKRNIRKFIKTINEVNRVTVILTTHDLTDVEELCSRLIVIDNGKLIEDGDLWEIVDRIAPHRHLIVETDSDVRSLRSDIYRVVDEKDGKVTFEFSKRSITASALISEISSKIKIIDLKIKEPNIEDVIDNVYNKKE